MAKYYRLHRGKIIGGNKGRKKSKPRDLKQGVVYEIRYDSKTASKERYLILILNLYMKLVSKNCPKNFRRP